MVARRSKAATPAATCGAAGPPHPLLPVAGPCVAPRGHAGEWHVDAISNRWRRPPRSGLRRNRLMIRGALTDAVAPGATVVVDMAAMTPNKIQHLGVVQHKSEGPWPWEQAPRAPRWEVAALDLAGQRRLTGPASTQLIDSAVAGLTLRAGQTLSLTLRNVSRRRLRARVAMTFVTPEDEA